MKRLSQLHDADAETREVVRIDEDAAERDQREQERSPVRWVCIDEALDVVR